MKFNIPIDLKQKFNNEYNSWADESHEIYLTVEREVPFDNLIEIAVSDNFIKAHPKWAEFAVQ
jgi:hypothetical protein